MLTKEILFGTTLFFCGFIPFVFSKDAYTINKEILDMKEHAKTLSQEHTELVATLQKLEQDCEKNLKQIEIKNTEVDNQIEVKRREVDAVTHDHGQAKMEEHYSMDALKTAYTKHHKYTLKVELYNQELQQLQNRKTTKLSERCHLMEPQFEKYGDTRLTTRSLPGQTKASDRAEIIVLQNQLNLEKIIVTKLISKISELKKKLKQLDSSVKKI